MTPNVEYSVIYVNVNLGKFLGCVEFLLDMVVVQEFDTFIVLESLNYI